MGDGEGAIATGGEGVSGDRIETVRVNTLVIKPPRAFTQVGRHKDDATD
jgi:hypothetical protein